MVKIILNGKEKMIEEEKNIYQFLESVHIDTQRTVIKLNDIILGKSRYSSTILKDGDRIDVIPVMGGG
jgi:sulfur carrier protein